MAFRKIFKALSLSMILFVAAGSGLSVYAASAASKADLDRRIEQTKESLKQGQEKQSKLEEQIRSVNEQIEGIQNEITALNDGIKQKQREIDHAEENLKAKKAEIGIQNQSLDTRLCTMYKSADTGMIEVILGSSDISELISNLGLIQKIYSNDARLLQTLEEQFVQLEEEQKMLAVLKEELYGQKNEKQAAEKELSEKMEELQKFQKQVRKDNQALEQQLDQLNRESEELTKALQNQELASSNSGNSSYEGGAMLWPVPDYKRISSKYGYRNHPILHTRKLHTGLDISAASGSQILAASDGKVIYASVRGGYGNCVMIDHGGGIVTLYGHCSRLLVSNGQTVARGQNIALVGSTGLSTGPHCHFEVRVNGSTTDPMKYLTGSNASTTSFSSAASSESAVSSQQTTAAAAVSGSGITSGSDAAKENQDNYGPAENSRTETDETEAGASEENTEASGESV